MSEVGNNKTVQYPSSDTISNLPCNNIDDILMRLPLRDAVRTSILSREWRRRWANIPQLVFNHTFPSRGILQQPTNHDRIMKTIYEVVLLHSGPLQKFDLSVSGLKSCPEIDRLILFLSEKDIQDFTLQISGQNWHKLPSCFFSFSQLRFLTLYSCIWKPPPCFKGFSKLICLIFWKVRFEAHLFKNFISSCPLLEKLTLYLCSEISCFDIHAPNLKVLTCVGILKSISFKSTPLLQVVNIIESSAAYLDYGRGKICNLIEVFNCLPAVELLRVNYSFLKMLVIPSSSMRLQTTLNHLKYLHIYFLSFEEMEVVKCLLFLLRISPNLEEIKIAVNPCQNASTSSFLQLLGSDDYKDFSLNQLKKVELQRFTGTKPQVELVKLLLATSSALKMMHIKFYCQINANERLRILVDLIRFKRASMEAEIICEIE